MYALMVVPSDFPNGDAGAVRDDAFAQIYRDLGYEVKLVGKGKCDPKGIFNKIEYISVYENIPGIRGQITRFLYDHNKYKKVIESWIEEYGFPSVIHINSVPEKLINYLIDIAEQNNIPIVHDSVEWYSACEFRWGKLDKAYILKDRLNRKIVRKPIRVFSISSFLNDYFSSKGIISCRIPVIMDVLGTKFNISKDDNKVRLIYAGSPANKDYLKEIVLGVEMLNELEKQKVEFNILGATEEQVKALTGLDCLSSCIYAHGRVSREVVKNYLLKSDFAVLLRPSEERYAMAGFPTKSVEAMSHGVAMLCNISSDLGMYLKDMENSVIIDSYRPEDLVSGLRRILILSKCEIEHIKYNSRLLAEKNFDYRLWENSVKKIIEG